MWRWPKDWRLSSRPEKLSNVQKQSSSSGRGTSGIGLQQQEAAGVMVNKLCRQRR
jgi:hypothetical protein